MWRRVKTHRFSMLLLAVALSTSAAGCDDSKAEDSKAAEGKSAEGKPAESKPAAKSSDSKPDAPADAGGSPKAGDSCEGISAADGLIACEGNSIIICSSFSEYKWTKQSDCEDGTKCVAEGKSASCQ